MWHGQQLPITFHLVPTPAPTSTPRYVGTPISAVSQLAGPDLRITPGNYLLRPSRLSRQPILSFNTAGTWGLVAFDAFDAIDASLFSASTRCCTRVVTPNPSFIFPVHLHRPTSGGRTFDAFDALDTLDAYPEAPYHLFADVTVFPGGSGDLADPFLFSLPITVSVNLLGAGGRHATSCVTS